MIRQLAAAERAPRIAAAAFERRVTIWDLETQRRVADFDSVLDFGGRRLALTPDGARCVVGAYDRHEVVCYTADNGARLWQRQDIKRVQTITVSTDGRRLFCGFDDGPCRVLDTNSGEQVARWRGVRRVIESPFQPWLLQDARTFEVRALTGEPIARISRETFGLLDVVFTPTALVISESTGSVRCVGLPSGKLLWRYQPAPGRHIFQLGFDPSTDRVLGVEWPYEQGGPRRLLAWQANTGVTLLTANVGEIAETVFCQGGTRLLLSDGNLVNTLDAIIVAKLPFNDDHLAPGA